MAINSKDKGKRGDEVWKPIPGYEGYYEVSNMGRVRSLERRARFVSIHGKECTRRVRGRIVRGTEHCTQHRITVMLSKEGEKERVSVHRLVATAFVENPNGYDEVNHKDENPRNNRADNLEWCTRQYNMNYGTIRERVYNKMKRPLVAINDEGDAIQFSSVKVAEQVGFVRHKIEYAKAQGVKYKGFFWESGDE